MIYKAYKYRIYPNKEQEELISKHIGCSRWIYNYALNKKNKSYQETGKGLSRFDIQKDLPSLKKEENTSWLKEVNSQTLQASLENLDKAYTKFFKEKKVFLNLNLKKIIIRVFLYHKIQLLILKMDILIYQNSKLTLNAGCIGNSMVL